MNIKIYGFDTDLYPCFSCQNIKEFLNEHNTPFEFIQVIEKGPDGKIKHNKVAVKQLEDDYGDDVTGISLPQIFVNNKYVGGSGIFKKKFLEGEFK